MATDSTKFLDLDMVFDPDRQPGSHDRPPASEVNGVVRTALIVTPTDLPPDWHFEWDERAAIMEYDGEMPRERAEMLALQDVLKRMREQGVIP